MADLDRYKLAIDTCVDWVRTVRQADTLDAALSLVNQMAQGEPISAHITSPWGRLLRAVDAPIRVSQAAFILQPQAFEQAARAITKHCLEMCGCKYIKEVFEA